MNLLKNPPHNPVARISPEVPVHLSIALESLGTVQEFAPPGSLLWLYAHVAKRVIRLSLETLGQPPAARLHVCAKPRPRLLAHLDAATDKALSAASHVIDDLFHNMAREASRRAVAAELPGGTPGHRPPPVCLATAQADLKRIQASAPWDSPQWLHASNALYAIDCALRELESARPEPRAPHQGGTGA